MASIQQKFWGNESCSFFHEIKYCIIYLGGEMYMKEIRIQDIEGVRIGQTEDSKGATGCTVIISEKGMAAGLDVRGGGPASRESELLKPVAHASHIHAVVLAGGSAFGLDAAGGVMKYLEEHDIGYDVGITKVPLVCQSDLFDLTVGDPYARPDKEMGYQACLCSENGGNYQDGNYGVGCGATVGKIMGMDYCMKSGIGSYAIQIGELKIGAIVVVNSLGDIFDYKTQKKIAGLLAADKKSFACTCDVLLKHTESVDDKFTGNTTLGVILTNGKFNKTSLCKIASMAQNGYARSINPVHTSADGDSIYALSLGDIDADQDLVGTMAAQVMSEAITRAIESADSAYGLPGYKEIVK